MWAELSLSSRKVEGDPVDLDMATVYPERLKLEHPGCAKKRGVLSILREK